MTGQLYYPKANKVIQNYGNGNATMDMAHPKLLWHTTETTGWPSYSGGATAPNATYRPATREWRQHFPANGSSRALKNAGTYRTNRADVFQVEIVWYAGKILDLPDTALQDLAECAVWFREEWECPLKAASLWVRYPDSYGANASQRMSIAQFDAFEGQCGHEHAPGNEHGDPGNLNVSRVLEIAYDLIGAEEPHTPNLTIATKAIVLAYYGSPMNTVDSFFADANQMLAWGGALPLQPVRPVTRQAWVSAISADDFARAGELFKGAIRNLQDYFGLPQGDELLDVILRMKRYGYTIISYEGKPI